MAGEGREGRGRKGTGGEGPQNVGAYGPKDLNPSLLLVLWIVID